jgi:hypothetical protein
MAEEAGLPLRPGLSVDTRSTPLSFMEELGLEQGSSKHHPALRLPSRLRLDVDASPADDGPKRGRRSPGQGFVRHHPATGLPPRLRLDVDTSPACGKLSPEGPAVPLPKQCLRLSERLLVGDCGKSQLSGVRGRGFELRKTFRLGPLVESIVGGFASPQPPTLLLARSTRARAADQVRSQGNSRHHNLALGLLLTDCVEKLALAGVRAP